MTDPSADRSEERRLLIIVSDRADLSASVRSRVRDVMRWGGRSAGEGDARRSGEHLFHGDPADPRTYHWVAPARGLSAVVDLADTQLRRAVEKTLRTLRPDAALLILRGQEVDEPGDGTVVRPGPLRDALRLDLDEELGRLEAERRMWCLHRFVEGEDTVPIVLHPDPDPDALSSALAVRVLLGRDARRAPVVTLRTMTRPENRRMADLLNLDVVEVSAAELDRYGRVVAVDTQPGNAGAQGGARWAVIDHHPAEEGLVVGFRDIRPDYGATATLLTEYLRAAPDCAVGSSLATALLYGIRTDTAMLTRGLRAEDVEAYAWLQDRADPALLRRIERPAYTPALVRAFGTAVAGVVLREDVAVGWAGRLDSDHGHVLSDLADLCLGIEGAAWAAAGAVMDGELVLALRHMGPGPGAGEVARKLAGEEGRGGGHGTMARATVSAADEALDEAPGSPSAGAWLADRLLAAISRPRPPRVPRETGPAGGRP